VSWGFARSLEKAERECGADGRITEGVRLAGFGAGFAPMRWLDILRVRGALGE